jgi:hypothetical protein
VSFKPQQCYFYYIDCRVRHKTHHVTGGVTIILFPNGRKLIPLSSPGMSTQPTEALLYRSLCHLSTNISMQLSLTAEISQLERADVMPCGFQLGLTFMYLAVQYFYH